MTTPELNLWRAVLTRQVMDAVGLVGSTGWRNEQYYINQAQSYINNPNSDFITVCDYAQVDPSYVRKQIKIMNGLSKAEKRKRISQWHKDYYRNKRIVNEQRRRAAS